MTDAEWIELAKQQRLNTSPDPVLEQARYLRIQQESAPEGERGFLANLSEAFERGQEGVLADVAVYEALCDPAEDLTGTLIARRKLQQKALLDPVEGRYLIGLAYKSANTAGQVLENAKRAATGSLIGAIAGGVISGVVSAIIPTVGEEPAAVGAGIVSGAKLGAKVGGHGSSGIFMYKQGVGAMYADMVDQGIDPAIAKEAAGLGGLPYAAIEMLQFKLLGAPAKRIITGKVKSLLQAKALAAITKGVGTYVKTLGGEWAEEMAQEVVQIATEQGAKAYQEGGLNLDKDFLNDTVQRMYSVGKGALEAFALLPIPGAALEAGVSWASAHLDNETASTIKKVDDAGTVNIKDVADPEAQLYFSLRQGLHDALNISDSAEREAYASHVERANKAGRTADDFNTFSVKYRSRKLFREQEKARAAERSERLGARATAIRMSSNAGEWVSQLRGTLKGEMYTKLGIEPLQTTLPIETFNNLREGIRTNTKALKTMEAASLDEALRRMYFEGDYFRPHELGYASKVWGRGVVDMLTEISRLNETKQLHPITTANDFARAMASSADASIVLRQNALFVGQPKVFLGAMAKAAKLLTVDEKTARIIQRDLETSEEGVAAIHYGVRVNEFGPGVGYERGAEAFPSEIAGRIPGMKRAQWSFVIPGNYARIKAFGEIWRANKGAYSTKQFQDLAKVINILGAEGDVKALGKYAHTLNSIFFAPRNFFARVETFTELLDPKLSWVARKYLAWNIAKFAGINFGILAAMAQVPGVSVEDDPRATDFGKIVIGNTHIDFWAGYSPMFRAVWRLATGERKTASGQIVDADMKDTVARFLQAKLGPLPAAALDMWRGETFWGEERNIGDVNDLSAEIYEKITPFFIQDLIDAIRYQGLAGAATAPLSFFGASTQTYPMTKSTEVALKRNELSQEVFGTAWDQLGPDGQKFMRAKFPEVELMEREATFEREHRYFMDTIEKNLKRSQKKMYEGMPRDIRGELDSLKITLSGVNRRVGTNWYLNTERYTAYEDSVLTAYKDVLPRLIRSTTWNKLNPLGKVEILKRVTEELKEAARKRIITDAKLSDLKRIRYGGKGTGE